MNKKYPHSDHFDGEKFHNLEFRELNSLWSVFKWKWTGKPKDWPKWVENKSFSSPVLPVDKKAAVTFINHATFLIQFPKATVITDPIFSERASPFKSIGPKRVRAPGIHLEQLPAVDAVVISHNHYDHLDLESLKALDAKFHPVFIVPLGLEKFLKEEGLQNVIERDWWQDFRVKDVLITLTPAQHWSSRTFFDKNETLWGSFLLDSGDFKVYFAGDTGYAGHFRDIKARYGVPDVSLLPIGAYEPRWFMKGHHMNPEDAVLAHLDLGSPLSIGMHHGTFQMANEGMLEPTDELNKAKTKHNISDAAFICLQEGESRVF